MYHTPKTEENLTNEIDWFNEADDSVHKCQQKKVRKFCLINFDKILIEMEGVWQRWKLVTLTFFRFYQLRSG